MMVINIIVPKGILDLRRRI